MEASVLSSRAVRAQGHDEFKASEFGLEDAREEGAQDIHFEGYPCILEADGHPVHRAGPQTLVLGDHWGDLQVGHKWARCFKDVVGTVS